jgi:serine/threonine protein kinase
VANNTQQSDRPDPLIGATIDGRFVVRRVLGEGGMGTVYEAFQKGLETPVAVKVLHARFVQQGDVLKRFQGEAKIASSLQHQNVVVTHSFGLLDNVSPFIVMELLDGISLTQLIKEKGSLDKASFISIFTQCCAGLLAAHELGIVHRDIKPSNIMLIKQPDGKYLVKLTDFGIAKWEESPIQSVTRTGQVLGTPLYMSPEQCEAKSVDHRSDIYSLGCVMYECLTGKPPFAADNAYETMMKHVNAEPESPTENHLHLRKMRPIVDAVMHTLQKNPEARPQTMGQLRTELMDAERGVSSFKRKRILRFPSWTWKVVACCAVICVLITYAGLAHQLPFSNVQKQAVNENDPNVIFEQAEAMQKEGRREDAARRYMQYLSALFGHSPDEHAVWHVDPRYKGEQNLRRILQAVQGADQWTQRGWPDRDPWYQLKNAVDDFVSDNGFMPPWVVNAFEAKIKWIREQASVIPRSSATKNNLAMADNLEKWLERYRAQGKLGTNE